MQPAMVKSPLMQEVTMGFMQTKESVDKFCLMQDAVDPSSQKQNTVPMSMQAHSLYKTGWLQ